MDMVKARINGFVLALGIAAALTLVAMYGCGGTIPINPCALSPALCAPSPKPPCALPEGCATPSPAPSASPCPAGTRRECRSWSRGVDGTIVDTDCTCGPIPSPAPCPSPSPLPACPPGQWRETDGHEPWPCTASIMGACVGPSPSPSSAPSPTPSAAPTPQPPAPSPSPTCPPGDSQAGALPARPVRPLVSGATCGRGLEPLTVQGRTLCIAPSIEDGTCHPCRWHLDQDLRQGHIVLTDGWPTEDSGVRRDAYCRRVIGDAVIAGEAGSWVYQGDCAPKLPSAPAPCVTPTPGPTPQPTPGPVPSGTPTTSVDKMLLLNYGKCTLGAPWILLLDGCPTGAKELFATATPKTAFDRDGDGKADDATDHGENLAWTVTYQGQTQTVTDSGPVDIGCAVVAPGPTNLRWNRRIAGRSPCRFELHVWLVTPDGKKFDKGQTVEVR